MLPGVIHVAAYTASYGGNFLASLLALDRACARQQLRVVLVFPAATREQPWCADLVAAGQAVRFLEGGSLLSHARTLRRIADEENGMLFHTHFIHFDLAAWLACRVPLRGRRLRLVWHAHSSLSARVTWKRPWKNLVKYRGAGRLVQMIAVSPQVAGELVAAGVPASRVRAIRNGIDLARATSAARSKEQVFADLDILPDKQLLLMFGWDPLRKGVDLALDAVGRLVAAGRPLVLGILGTERLQEYLRGQMARTAMPWMRTIAPTEDIASLYQAASAFLTPSRSEGLTYAACEAMANGTPVVLADSPPFAWAKDCPGAAFCAGNDSRALSDAIQTVLDWTPAELQRRACGSREFVADFAVDRWAEQLVAFYQGMLCGTTSKH